MQMNQSKQPVQTVLTNLVRVLIFSFPSDNMVLLLIVRGCVTLKIFYQRNAMAVKSLQMKSVTR